MISLEELDSFSIELSKNHSAHVKKLPNGAYLLDMYWSRPELYIENIYLLSEQLEEERENLKHIE